MKQIKLDVGSVYGRLTVIDNTMYGRFSAAICKCECGTVKTIRRYSLTNNNPKVQLTRSCGCLALEAARIALKCDRGSSFATPEAYAAHRKIWKQAYEKVYNARPEQRLLRIKQTKDRFDRMTPDQKENEKEKHRAYSARPYVRAKAQMVDAAYMLKPGVSEAKAVRVAIFHANARDTLSDAYVADCFRQETSLKRAEIPPEVIAAARESMRLKRKIKELNK